jgi:hypothetical protein
MFVNIVILRGPGNACACMGNYYMVNTFPSWNKMFAITVVLYKHVV